MITILLILALICFLLGTFGLQQPPVNWVPLGLAFCVIAWLVSSGVIKI